MTDNKQLPVYAKVLTEVGGRRTNEDAVYACDAVEKEKIETRGHLYIVADGTGGQKGGQTASSMAAEIIGEHFYDDDESTADIDTALRSAVETAHEALYQLAQRVSAWAEMSTTLVAVVINKDKLHIAHVGDSRAYLIRDSSARLLTRDHVWLEDDDNYGSLTRWLGGTRPSVEVELSTQQLQDGDKILLCSDGLTNVVDSQDIQAYVSKFSPSQAAQSLIDLANRRGTSDNVSTAVIQYGGEAPKGSSGSKVLWYAGGGVIAVIAFVILLLSGLFTGKNDGDIITSTPMVVETKVEQKAEDQLIATPTKDEGSLATPKPTVTADLWADEKRATSTPIPATDTPTPRPTSPPPTYTATPLPPTPTLTPSPDSGGGNGNGNDGGNGGGGEPER